MEAVDNKLVAAKALNAFIATNPNWCRIDTDWDMHEDIIVTNCTLEQFISDRNSWSEKGILTRGSNHGHPSCIVVESAQAAKGEKRKNLFITEIDSVCYIYEA